jgi:hypothetical protein
MWKSPRVEMYIEGEADEATLLKRLAALLLFSQPDTCRGSGDTMIAT